jgi:cytochrome P450
VSRPATRVSGTHHQVSAAVSALPVTVIAELLGLPAADRELFRSWTDRLFASDMADPNDPELARKIDESTADMVTYLGGALRRPAGPLTRRPDQQAGRCGGRR